MAQCRLFIDRFPTDFMEMAMSKFVLPYSAEAMPFLAPDGHLPCPALSTVNALRWLEANPDFLKSKGNNEAIAQIKKIHEKGVQVEWVEYESFLQWQLAVEH